MGKTKNFLNGYDNCALCSVELTQQNNSYHYGCCIDCYNSNIGKLIKRVEERTTFLVTRDVKAKYDKEYKEYKEIKINGKEKRN